MTRFGPCLCGDTTCPSCGPAQGYPQPLRAPPASTREASKTRQEKTQKRPGEARGAPSSTPQNEANAPPARVLKGKTPPPGAVRALSWGDVAYACRSVAAQVRALGSVPDYVLAVANGGLAPAAFLRNLLGVESVGAVQFSHYVGAERRKGGPRQWGLLPSPIRNGYKRRVLVVDEVVETVDTLRMLEGELDGHCPAVVWAVLFRKGTPARLPEPFLFAEEMPAGTWLKFPWEVE